MSIQLGPITLTPGTPVRIPLQNISGVIAAKLTNGSPFDLSVTGFGFQGVGTVPAGTEYMLDASVENSGTINILPVNNVGVSGNGIANLDVYIQGEKVPVGTWPITVPPQTVQAKVSTVTTLINDGNTNGTQIIESSPVGQASTTSVTNDGLWVLKTLVAGALHQFLKTQNVGNLLQLGQAGDVAEVLGALTVDQLLTAAANILLPNNIPLQSKDSGGTVRNLLALDASNISHFAAGGANQYSWFDNAAAELARLTNLEMFSLHDFAVGGLTDVSAKAAIRASDGHVIFDNGSFTTDGGGNLVNTPSSTVLNGSTSGTATLYMEMRGTVKRLFLFLNNFRNGGASAQTIALPTTFGAFGYCRTTSFPAAQLLKTGAPVTVNVITTLAVGGGTSTGATVFGGYSFFDFQANGFDTVSFNSGQATAHTGGLIIEGV